MKLEFSVRPGIPNLNGVIFPEDVFDKAITEFIESRPIWGSLGQPKETITEDNAAFELIGIEKTDTGYIGEVNVLDTQDGNLLKLMLADNQNIKIVTTSIGTIENLTPEKSLEEEVKLKVADMEMKAVGVLPKEECA